MHGLSHTGLILSCATNNPLYLQKEWSPAKIHVQFAKLGAFPWCMPMTGREDLGAWLRGQLPPHGPLIFFFYPKIFQKFRYSLHIVTPKFSKIRFKIFKTSCIFYISPAKENFLGPPLMTGLGRSGKDWKIQTWLRRARYQYDLIS